MVWYPYFKKDLKIHVYMLLCESQFGIREKKKRGFKHIRKNARFSASHCVFCLTHKKARLFSVLKFSKLQKKTRKNAEKNTHF